MTEDRIVIFDIDALERRRSVLERERIADAHLIRQSRSRIAALERETVAHGAIVGTLDELRRHVSELEASLSRASQLERVLRENMPQEAIRQIDEWMRPRLRAVESENPFDGPGESGKHR